MYWAVVLQIETFKSQFQMKVAQIEVLEHGWDKQNYDKLGEAQVEK